MSTIEQTCNRYRQKVVKIYFKGCSSCLSQINYQTFSWGRL